MRGPNPTPGSITACRGQAEYGAEYDAWNVLPKAAVPHLPRARSIWCSSPIRHPALLTLLPFSWAERGNPQSSAEEVIIDGGFPPIAIERRDKEAWFASYIATYVERDVRYLHAVQDLTAFQRFLRMAATRVGQPVNYASLARDCCAIYWV